MFNLKFPRPRVQEPPPTARRRNAATQDVAAACPNPVEQDPPTKHRFLIHTEDFLTGGGEPMKRYSVVMYGPTAHAASLRALDLIENRFHPGVMPQVTRIECDMGCWDRYHN